MHLRDLYQRNIYQRSGRNNVWFLPYLLFIGMVLLFSGCQRESAVVSGGLALGQNFVTAALANRAAAAEPAVQQATTPTMDVTTAGTNRLLVQGLDGNLFTIAPDGTQRLTLTDDADRRRLYTQPTWSSNGERVAWAAVQQTADGPRSALVTALANGTERTVAPVPFPPFYLYWSPDDSTLAYLSNWLSSGGQTIALRAVDVAGGGEIAKTVDTGQPYYFSWAPDSRQVIAHVGNQQVRLLTVTGEGSGDEPQVLVDQSANFAAPQWYQATEAESTAGRLLYVLDDESTALLVVSDTTGEDEEFLTYLSRQDFVSFNMNATGSHIAYIETTDMVGFNSLGPLFIYNLEEEIFEQLSTDPAVAFFWSPDGSALYFLTGELISERIWFRVNIWDGEAVQQYARFLPTQSFLTQYLRFADQYMQSMRFWSPDSQSVVYSGQSEDGQIGIWIQTLDPAQSPILVTPGRFATWSPR